MASVVGKTIFSDGKGKLFFGYYKTDDAVEFVDYKTWKKLNFKDVSKGDTNKERVIKAILKKQKQFNKKVDFNMWAKKQKRSFEDTMDWFIQNGWVSNITKRGIKEGVEDVLSVNEAKNDEKYVVIAFHEKGGGFVMTRPSSKKDAEDSARSITKSSDITKQKAVKVSDARKISGLVGKEYLKESINEGKKRFNTKYGVGKAKYVVNYHDGKKKHKDGSDFFDIQIFKNQKDFDKFQKALLSKGFVQEGVTEDKGEVEKIAKQVGKNEIKFYDALSKVEKRLGSKYPKFLDTALKQLKQNPAKFKTNADKEEAIFQSVK